MELKRGSLRQRVLSGTAVGCFGALVVVLGGWWFTAAVGVIVHLGLLEFFRMAQFKGIRPATKTCLLYTSPSPRDATLSRMPSSA